MASVWLWPMAMVEEIMQRYGFESFERVGTAKGASLENLVLQHPLYARDSLLVVGDYVTTEAGTGCVHTAPDHGVDDFYTGKRYNLELLDPVNDNGVFRANVETFGGEHVSKVDAHMLEALRNAGKLVHDDKFATAIRIAGAQKHSLSFALHTVVCQYGQP